MPTIEEKYRTFPRIVPLTKGDFVGKELLRRKKETFGQGNVPRAIWLRALSNAVPTAPYINAGKIVGNLNVMVGGLLSENFHTRASFETLYKRPGRQIQDKPIPGIDGINITSKGEVQSLRKVTISWTCPNLEDLDALTPYWLTPGVSVWLEWGWSYLNRTPITVDMLRIDKLQEYYEDAGKIYEDIIRESNGNQDGYMGVITNFSFNSNDDNSWSCTTELSALGQTLIGIDLNKDKVYKEAVFKDDKSSGKSETIKGFIEGKFSEGDLKKLSIYKPFKEDSMNPESTKLGGLWQAHGDVFHASRAGAFGWDALAKDVIFVSWRFIEQAIINQAVAFEYDGNGGKGQVFSMNSNGIEISNDHLLYTTDAKIGLVVHTDIGNGAFSFDKNGNPKIGKMSHLYFNTEFVKDTFLNSENLEEAAMKLLRGISNACGDIWDFKLQPHPLLENIVQVIDLNYTSFDDIKNVEKTLLQDVESNDKILSFGGFSGESILANVEFTSKLTDQLALKFFIGRNKPDDSKLVVNDDNDAGIKPIFGYFTDRVLPNVESPEAPPLTSEEKAEIARRERAEKNKKKNFSLTLLKFKESLRTGTKVENSESGWPSNIIVLEKEAKEFLVEYLNRELAEDDGKIVENRVRHQPIYPLEVSVTIDGVSGILPGNCFILDNLPKLYRNSGVFQVVEVGHDVSGDDWATNLRCFFKYTKEDTKKTIYYDPNAQTEEEVETPEPRPIDTTTRGI